MAACTDVEFEIDEASKTDSNNSSHQNVMHSENNQNDLTKKSFFQLDPNWSKKSFADEVSESNIIVTGATENDTNKISKVLSEVYENAMRHTSIWFSGRKLSSAFHQTVHVNSLWMNSRN